ncbi:UNVERIFIED_CONTAM: hypothetical protein GTU68_015742 [Idotea baltica]|nr:hypothetical protein [Idotea baltica]
MSNLLESYTDKLNFYDLDRESLSEYLVSNSIPKFRAKQLFEWVYRHQITDFDQMTNISKELRDKLKEVFIFPEAEVKSREISNDGTRKYLFAVSDKIEVESVMIQQEKRMTLCLSSQYGCGMGCTFCRTGTMGFLANLSPSEIMKQVLGVIKDAKEFNDMFTNIVFMGMGEPLHNHKSLFKVIRILTDPSGLAIAPRKITVSTVGLVPAIKKFAEADLGVNLAISLNATNNKVRSEIMPINDNFPLEVLLDTVRNFPLKGRKRITFEYVMLKDVNDTLEDLKRLIAITRKLPVKINLIPYNENTGLGFFTPPKSRIYKWQEVLNSNDISATIRWSKGQDINAACGQLKSQN